MENGGKAGGVTNDVAARATEAGHRLEEQLEDVRGFAEEATDRLRDFARDSPGVAIAIAAGFGFILGRIFSRT